MFKHIMIFQGIVLTFTFSRRFYPKQLTLHSSDSFYILSALAFPGNQTHDFGVANTMLYQLSYRNSIMTVSLCIRQESKRNDDSVSVEELDWSAESQVLIPVEHFWCDFII